MAITTIDTHTLLKQDMERVDQLIQQQLSSEVVLINQMSAYIIGSGGKRLRPQLVLLAARACEYQGEQHILLAAVVEFIHTATLLHDDVVDVSSLRRGQETANAVWGNEAAVLVGDFLYSRAFEMMVAVQDLRVMAILAKTTNKMSEGEVMQLLNVHEPGITEAQYISVIEAKTARLFQAAAELGAVLGQQTAVAQKALADYGMYLGTAFQIMDDVLDYQSDSEALGKNVGDDLAEGKTTLPLIYAMRDGDAGQRKLIADAIVKGGLDALPAVLEIMQETRALGNSVERARLASVQAASALSVLADSPFKRELLALAAQSVQRKS